MGILWEKIRGYKSQTQYDGPELRRRYNDGYWGPKKKQKVLKNIVYT